MLVNFSGLKVLLLSVISLWACNISLAQANEVDTLFVLIEKQEKTGKGLKESDPYPKDYRGGRDFVINKLSGRYEKEILFGYNKSYPPWMDSLYYRFEHVSILEKEDFKNEKWFKNTDYHKIIGIFKNAKTVFLVEKNRIKNDTLCLIEVFFYYDAEE